ncbi:cytochrome c [Deferribacter autotrophicus]|uniref:Cytochrome c n=1 Tax=Deferribacter autotrophicus TaxID=500465 RepID=A0A5A8F5X1_9BACT|nr:cytochrome c [Deferribacter autotrophicus]KAA0257058.1 cytochrome c [Deferribacter autotrophicus]
MKKVLIFVLVSFFASMTIYAGKSPDAGRNIWKKYCRLACHDGKKVDFPKLAPNSKTQEQWKNVFANNRKYLMDVHKGIDFGKLKDIDWKKIEMFVVNHAYDSNQPESCETTEYFVK